MTEKSLSHYKIIEKLGQGGMGEVFLAEDKNLNRQVAVKVLPNLFVRNPERLARFDREAKLLASINHPNIAAIYELERTDSSPLLVMEFVDGETLAQRIERGPLPIEDALKLSCQIAEGIEAAHAKGVIHRDLKPSNIKITPEEKVKILDFGLAKGSCFEFSSAELSDSPTTSMAETIEGKILGTVAYMSPEQTRGQSLDKRSDIWSFGCITYEMLTGRKPFGGKTASDKIAAILGRDPDWGLLPEKTPFVIRELLRRCLQKDLNQRLRDICYARMELEKLLNERTAPGPHFRLGRRALLLVGLLAIVICLLGIWVAHRPHSALPAHKYLVVLPFKDLSGDQQGQLMADGFGEMVSGQLSKVQSVRVIPPVMIKSVHASNTDLTQLAKVLRANLFLETSMQRTSNQIRVVYSILNLTEESLGIQVAGGTVDGAADDVLALEDRFAETVMGDLQLQFEKHHEQTSPAGLSSPEAKASYLKALGYLQRYENEGSVDNALALLKELGKTDSALVQAALGRAYFYKYDLTHQRTWANEAMASCQLALHLQPQMPEVHVTLGFVEMRTGHAMEGIREFQQALSAQPDWPDAVLGLAEAYEKAGRLPEAKTTYLRAIELQPGYWSAYNKLGNFYLNCGQYAQALEMYQEVLKLCPDNSRGYNNLGVALQQMSRFDEAAAAYKKSIELLPNGDAYSNLGTLDYMLGRYAEAAEADQKAVGLVPKKSTFWANLGDAYRWNPRLHSKALEAYQEAIRLSDDELRVNPKNAVVHVTLALCYAKIGRAMDAQKCIRQALDLNPNDTDTMYQAAVVANICGKRQEALEWIKRAVQHNYPISALMQEPDLANLQKEKAFQEVMATKRVTTVEESH